VLHGAVGKGWPCSYGKPAVVLEQGPPQFSAALPTTHQPARQVSIQPVSQTCTHEQRCARCASPRRRGKPGSDQRRNCRHTC
jgi:hypothetical protein